MGAHAGIWREAAWAHGRRVLLHAGSAKGPDSSASLAGQLARHGRRGRGLLLLQQGHGSVEAGLLEEAGKFSGNLLCGRGHLYSQAWNDKPDPCSALHRAH